jgi:cytochrome c peroxidase
MTVRCQQSVLLYRVARLAGLALTLILTACHDNGVPAKVSSAQTVSVASVASAAQATQAAPVQNSLQMWVRYPQPNASPSPMAALGKQIFFDTSLSASGKMACSSCHDPNHAYGPPNGLAVQLGGTDMQHAGTRAVPSLRYMGFTPKFTRHYAVPDPDGVEDEGPTGGFTHDGAVDALHEQAKIPLLNVNEMANKDAAAVSEKLRVSTYADQFVKLFGADIFSHPDKALEQATMALEAFETEDASFQPYTSKFDAVMAGNADFTPEELRGYVLYNNPVKGNCAKCHIDSPGPGGRPAQFTDFGFEAVGVPRNAEIPANRDVNYFDLGLCGPARKDLARETNFCGMFKTPTLRNTATRQVFFHNGRFHNLEDTLHFYVERDTQPGKWYANKNGKLVQYDDMPAKYRGNIDHVNAPFNRKKGDAPAMNDDEIRDMIAFLKTLDDGYSQRSGEKRAN